MLVGHLPDLGALASELVAGHPHADVEFRKAAVCGLGFDGAPARGRARLEWLLPPKVLRALGGREG